MLPILRPAVRSCWEPATALIRGTLQCSERCLASSSTSGPTASTAASSDAATGSSVDPFTRALQLKAEEELARLVSAGRNDESPPPAQALDPRAAAAEEVGGRCW